jgi:hypothetical protein
VPMLDDHPDYEHPEHKSEEPHLSSSYSVSA